MAIVLPRCLRRVRRAARANHGPFIFHSWVMHLPAYGRGARGPPRIAPPSRPTTSDDDREHREHPPDVADIPAIPLKPSAAAITAMMKKTTA